jgi:hypothetical protein
MTYPHINASMEQQNGVKFDVCVTNLIKGTLRLNETVFGFKQIIKI